MFLMLYQFYITLQERKIVMSFNQEKRNIRAREEVEDLHKNHGLRMNFISTQIGLRYHSVANWKRGEYDFGEDRIKKVENLIEKYKNL